MALSVNIDKTKIMRFGRGKRETFKYNGQSIAITDQYKYLGIILSSTRWCYSKAIHRLCEQAKRGSFSTVRKLQSRLSGKLDPKTLLHVFDVAITPILAYNHVPCYRTALTKLRTTNHNLEIELGRRSYRHTPN